MDAIQSLDEPDPFQLYMRNAARVRRHIVITVIVLVAILAYLGLRLWL